MDWWLLAGVPITSFIVALSGALMPGPLLTLTVGEAARRGFWAGPLIIVGHALLELALAYGGGPVQIKEIAKSQKLPIRYLEQLLLILKRGGLVVSQRGKDGGYLLKKHPSDIPLLELVEYLDGKIELVSKNMKKTPVLFSTFQVVQDKIKAGLAEVSLEDLVIRKRQRERSYVYNI